MNGSRETADGCALGGRNSSGCPLASDLSDENIFDRIEVRAVFFLLYALVFGCCVVGNLLVILVVVLSRRLRSTEFFLGNLAISDFCVGIFCILQTINSYTTSTWIFGNFLCKMHYFVQSLSCSTSIFILIVISIERYLAIIHPIRCRRIMTSARSKSVIVSIWVVSIAYSSPRFIFAKAISHSVGGDVEVLCIISRVRFNSEVFDVVNFVLLYLLPLSVMSVLYALIARKLRESGKAYGSFHVCRTDLRSRKRPESRSDSCRSRIGVVGASVWSGGDAASARAPPGGRRCLPDGRLGRSVADGASCEAVLRARRGVVRMLVAVVLTFAACNISFHARKMWQYWSRSYDASSTFSSLFTPLTFLLVYCNSAINPILYAFLSRNFRKGMREISLWKFRLARSKTLSAESLQANLSRVGGGGQGENSGDRVRATAEAIRTRPAGNGRMRRNCGEEEKVALPRGKCRNELASAKPKRAESSCGEGQ